jgi:predicted transcriptional regulator of viral defense system
MRRSTQTKPDWDRLYETALAQEGHFTTQQALDAGYSSQLLVKYLDSGKIIRVRRSVYRLKHFPPGQQEDLVALWLWSDRAGVFSHETALMLHELSDVLPARAHLTLPAKWRKRRLRVPEGVVLHYADVPKRDRAWVGAVPVTSPARTLADSAADYVSPDSSPPRSVRRSRAGS